VIKLLRFVPKGYAGAKSISGLGKLIEESSLTVIGSFFWMNNWA
jgi:hypothetical protein